MKKIIMILSVVIVSCNGEAQKIKFLRFEPPKAEYNNGHRIHELGMTYLTYPPYYSCVYCYHEISPYDFLPEPYSSMKFPFFLNEGDKEPLGYFNGYGKFIDSLSKEGIKDYEWFMDRWNEKDTSCLSNEIKANKSETIWKNWKATHKPGVYYIDKSNWMSTDNFIGNDGSDSSTVYAAGGRFNDEILLADKWYKIILDKKGEKFGAIDRLEQLDKTKNKK